MLGRKGGEGKKMERKGHIGKERRKDGGDKAMSLSL